MDSTKLQVGIHDSIIIHRPTLPYAVEDAVRSVKHARQYLDEAIYTRHWYTILQYMGLVTLLFWGISSVSIRHLFIVLTVCVLTAVLLAFQVKDEQTVEMGKHISNVAYLFVPLLSCLWLVYSAATQKQQKGFVLAAQGLFVGVLLVLIGALFIIWRAKMETDSDTESFKSFQAPYNLAFYGVQALGIIGALLTTYVRSLPKA